MQDLNMFRGKNFMSVDPKHCQSGTVFKTEHSREFFYDKGLAWNNGSLLCVNSIVSRQFVSHKIERIELFVYMGSEKWELVPVRMNPTD